MAESVTVEDVWESLSQQDSESVLLLDCRSFLSYNLSHITSAHNVHCPPIVRRRAGKSLPIGNVLKCSRARAQLECSAIKSIVMYDEDSTDIASPSDESILPLVLNTLSAYKDDCKIQFLSGKILDSSTISS